MTWEKPLNQYCIYALKCPDTNVIKYIGQTTIGITRLYGHWRDFKLNKFGKLIRVKAWVKKIKSENKRFVVEYLDYAKSKEELNQKEIYWIKYFRELGLHLLNHADGGHIATVKCYTDAEKIIISERTKLAMAKPEVRANYIKGRANRVLPKKYKPRTEETKKAHRQSDYIKKKKIKIRDSDNVIYESLTDCAIKLSVTKQNVWRAIHKGGTVKGLTLKKLEI